MAYPQPVTKLMVQIRREIRATAATTWEQVEVPVPPKGFIRRIRICNTVLGIAPRVAYLISTEPYTLPLGTPPVVTPTNRLLASFPILFAGNIDHIPGYSMSLPLTSLPPALGDDTASTEVGPNGTWDNLYFYEGEILYLAWQASNNTGTMEIQIDIEVVGA